MKTKRVHCFVEGESEWLLSQFSPPETKMGKIYNLKSDVVDEELAQFRSSNGKCIVKLTVDTLATVNERMFFSFLKRSGIVLQILIE